MPYEPIVSSRRALHTFTLIALLGLQGCLALTPSGQGCFAATGSEPLFDLSLDVELDGCASPEVIDVNGAGTIWTKLDGHPTNDTYATGSVVVMHGSLGWASRSPQTMDVQAHRRISMYEPGSTVFDLYDPEASRNDGGRIFVGNRTLTAANPTTIALRTVQGETLADDAEISAGEPIWVDLLASGDPLLHKDAVALDVVESDGPAGVDLVFQCSPGESQTWANADCIPCGDALWFDETDDDRAVTIRLSTLQGLERTVRFFVPGRAGLGATDAGAADAGPQDAGAGDAGLGDAGLGDAGI